jgi:hypothetical protein
VEMLVENSSLYPSFLLCCGGCILVTRSRTPNTARNPLGSSECHSDVVGLGCCVGPSNCA